VNGYYRNPTLAVVFLAFSVTPVSFAAQTATDDYLSGSLLYRIWTSTQAWGELGINTCTHAPGIKPQPLKICDKTYDKGLGHHANGEIFIVLDGEYATFEAEIGVQKQAQNIGTVVFQVFVGDEKRFDSGVMRESDPARKISVPIAGAEDMRLVVTDAGDGITCDCANWANARLIRDPNAKARPAEARRTLDAAPFGRVVTWDPARSDGSHANRVQEFRTEDIFTETDVLPTADGMYPVPVARDGRGCIGLQWMERRLIREFGIQFADAAKMPKPEGAQIQVWVGESVWQGNFLPLKGAITAGEGRWTATLDPRDNPDCRKGIWKVRWIFPSANGPVAVRGLSAITRTTTETVELTLEPAKPLPGEKGRIDIHNGEIAAAEGGAPIRGVDWDLAKPLSLNVRYTKPRLWKPDRTVLRLRLPGGAVGVAVDDVLANGCVWVPEPGVFVAHGQAAKDGLAAYLKKIEGRKTVLQQVREMPDQTFEQAMAKVHRDVQNNGPVLLSLACDNHKFVVNRNGQIEWQPDAEATAHQPDAFALYSRHLRVRFGAGKNAELTRHTDGGWLPIPVTTAKVGDIVYTQRTFVAPSDKAPARQSIDCLRRPGVCVVEFAAKNAGSAAAEASLVLTFIADAKKDQPAEVTAVDGGVVVSCDGRLLAYADTSRLGTANIEIKSGTLTLTGQMNAGDEAKGAVYIPTWAMKSGESVSLGKVESLRTAVEEYWNGILAPAMQVKIPDTLLSNLIRASQVHCLIAARNEANGQRISPWIASLSYGPLESEANSIIIGMGGMGHLDFARRSLDFFIKRYSPAGYLPTGYTLIGTGWHLWALARYADLAQDTAWLKQNGPEVGRVCRWITQQREKMKHINARLEKVPEYGLMPPGVVADWNVFAYRVYALGHYYAGLANAARVLAAAGYPGADELCRNAEEFRQEIQRAWRWAQGNSPALALANGTWVPADPSMINCLDRVNNIYPGEDGNRSWASDVEIGAHHLVANGVFDAMSREATWMLDRLEDVEFLGTGMGEYKAEENHKDWFSLGGFAKIQPYYGRTADVYAMRDDVKPYIRAYFNGICTLFNTEVMTFWEHFHNLGAWNKTHETGGFLNQTRLMFVMERGDELWLAPFVTNNWQKDGMTVSVRNAPTHFGPVGYHVTSAAQAGSIEATIESPKRAVPKAIVIRMRHPEGKPMRAVKVNGVEHKGFDAAREIVRIEKPEGTVAVRAEY